MGNPTASTYPCKDTTDNIPGYPDLQLGFAPVCLPLGLSVLCSRAESWLSCILGSSLSLHSMSVIQPHSQNGM
jgi:hypothetical protein